MNSTTIPTKHPQKDFCHYCRWFFRDETMDLMEKYLSRVKLDRKMYKIYSKILGDHLWLVPTDKEMLKLVAEGIQEPAYTHDEIAKLENVSKEGLKKIHNVKKVFPGAAVEDIRRDF